MQSCKKFFWHKVFFKIESRTLYEVFFFYECDVFKSFTWFVSYIMIFLHWWVLAVGAKCFNSATTETQFNWGEYISTQVENQSRILVSLTVNWMRHNLNVSAAQTRSPDTESLSLWSGAPLIVQISCCSVRDFPEEERYSETGRGSVPRSGWRLKSWRSPTTPSFSVSPHDWPSSGWEDLVNLAVLQHTAHDPVRDGAGLWVPDKHTQVFELRQFVPLLLLLQICMLLFYE